MKAVAVTPATKSIGIISHEEPRIASPTEVKVRMIEVGVCGTDKEIARFDYGTPPAGSPDLIIGHESLGEVVETGAAVKDVKTGDLVVMMVRRPCARPDCVACRAGRQDFCFTGEYTERGIKGHHGFMTEFVVDDERYMTVVPPELRSIGVLVEPLTVAEKALMQVWDVQQRLPWGCVADLARAGEFQSGHCHRAVVLGAGPIGLLGALALLTAGFETYVYSRNSHDDPRVALIESFGAKFVYSEERTVAQLAEEVGNIDLVYEAVGASSLAFDVMKVLGTNGVFVFTGVPGRRAPVEVDTDFIMRNLVLRNQIFFGTVNASRENFQAAVADLARFRERWGDKVERLITGRFPIEAHADLLLGNTGGIKNVVTIT